MEVSELQFFSSFLVVGIRDAESHPHGSEFSGGHLCSDAGFRHRWSRADCAVEKTATQRHITMTQKLWEEINFFRMQCSTGLVAARGRVGRPGSSGDDSAQIDWHSASPLCTGSQQGGLVIQVS